MGLLDRFRKRKRTPSNESQKDEKNAYADFDPQAHHVLLEYLRHLWSGGQADLELERKTDLGFYTLNMAELLFAVSEERNVPRKRILHFLRKCIPGGGDAIIATLLERIFILADGGWGEQSRITLLCSGLAGDLRQEIVPIHSYFDKVDLLVKYCLMMDSLKALEDHEAIDMEFGEVEDDPGWRDDQD